MLWTVCHLWPSGDCFVSNCYFYHYSLVLRNGDGTVDIIHSREGVTQGEPLYMVAYKIGILMLVKCLKFTYPEATQPWYADYYGALDLFDNLEQYLNFSKHYGPYQGYYYNPTKSILTLHPNNLKAGKSFFQCHGFKVCTGASYIGGYIGDEKFKGYCLKNWTDKWESDICVLSKTAGGVSSEKLRHGRTCGRIGVDIFPNRDKRYGTGVCRAGKSSAVNLFSSYFLWKIETPPSNNKSSKYVSGK